METKKLKDKLTGLKIVDPIVIAIAVVLIVAVYFLVFSDDKRLDPTQSFGERVKEKQARDEERVEGARQRFNEKLERRSTLFEETKVIQEERKRANEAEARYKELQTQVHTNRERFPRLRFLEEIQAKSYFAPIAEVGEDGAGEAANVATTPHEDASSVRRNAAKQPGKASAAPRLEVRAGTWIPITLHNKMHAALAGHGTGTVREHVYDITGAHIAIPKGSRVMMHFVQKQDYFLSALVADEIITADGRHIKIPFPVHDREGATGLDPRKSGSFNRHLWQKIGMTSLIAAISTAPNLMTENVGDLAQLSYVERTTQGLQDLLKGSLNIPNEKTFNAGARINFLVVSSFTVPPGPAVNADRDAVRDSMDALKERIFSYQQMLEKQPEQIQRSLREHNNKAPGTGLVKGGN